MKKNILQLLSILVFTTLFFNPEASTKQKKMLVFTRTTGFRHTSAITSGKKAIQELGSKNNFAVELKNILL
jgi:hypothetical protein